ncbi:hypothetical protein [Actinotalea sp. JY-7876]|uniref:hypothetical protein n=1 Tax=Actinotalea sp. JY-7876 TaxID=2758442 RepID=UPI0015F37DAC|nr:hypothetical protein [Actinotalea sp. JY-7876]
MRVPGSSRLELISEVLVVGAVVAVLSLPVVTAVPALAAGARRVRRGADGFAEPPVRTVVRDTGRALRDWWALALGVPLLVLLVAIDVVLARSGALPGGTAVLVVVAAVAAVGAVVVLRACGTWEPGTRPGPALREAARVSGADLVGSALLLSAAIASGVLVWMLLPLAIVAGGLLALATVSVERRWALRLAGVDG